MGEGYEYTSKYPLIRERFGFDAQSQLMRWTYGAGLTEELNPFEVDFRNQGKK
ncbi:hypothetical protein O5623_17720 [Escherichia coli]|nr:hypothetical protein [Escherichia coli]